eukprot:jgi/Ulvmu1/10823/UM069_0059.1
MACCAVVARHVARTAAFISRCELSSLRCQHTSPEKLSKSYEYGQPVGETHSWVLQADEVAPGITFAELQTRRDALAELLPVGALALVPSAAQQFKSGVIPYPFRQDADFLWLTGVQQEGLAIFHKVSESRLIYTLLLNPVPATKAIWDGAGLSLGAAMHMFGVHEAFPLEPGSLRACLTSKLARGTATPTVFIDRNRSSIYAQRALGALEAIPPLQRSMQQQHMHSTEPLQPLLHRLRWLKSPGECDALRASAAAAAVAMRTCMAATRPGVSEGALEAAFDFVCRSRGGAQAAAFPAVVGGGANACTIHHRHTDERLREGDCVLMDAGGERWGYCSDVSRTWPVDARFRQPHRIVYEHVAEVHRACVAACVAGATLVDVHALSRDMLTLALLDIGVDLAGVDMRAFYPHSVGHWLGMDVHDVATVSHASQLQPGVVLTIEPGLYLRDMSGRVPREFVDIGVRIEDDVLVTAAGPEVLSDPAVAPVATEEVEALVGTQPCWV